MPQLGSLSPAHEPIDITASWLTAALRGSGHLGVESVTDVAVEGVGTGQMGVCAKVRAVYDADDVRAPAGFVVKLAAADPVVRSFMGPTGYRGELCFYRHLAARVRISAPRCYFAVTDGDWFALGLEDLSPARPGDQLAGCTPAQVSAAVLELVGLHAPLWGDPELTTHPCLAGAKDRVDLPGLMTAVMPGFLARYGEHLTVAHVGFFEQVAATSAQWGSAQAEVEGLEHGDFRADNLLFGERPDGVSVAAVDWQGVSLGDGGRDLALLIGGALTVEERRQHEDELLRHYHDAMGSAGVERGWDGCWNTYRLGVVRTMPTLVLGSMYSTQTERGDAMFVQLAHRFGEMALDLDIPALLNC
jgi:hypothetical protein